MSKQKLEGYNKGGKQTGGTVIYIGELKCKISLTPRTATETDKEASMRALRNAKFFERDETMYRMRRDHVRTAAITTTSKEPRGKTASIPQRNSLGGESAKPSHSKKASQLPAPSPAPFLGIGNWQPTSPPTLHRSLSQPACPHPQSLPILHSLPVRIRTSPRMFEAIPVKSFVMVAGSPLDSETADSKEAWGRSDFYRSYIALMNGPRPGGSVESSPVRLASPMVVREEEEEKTEDEYRSRWCHERRVKEDKDSGVQPRISIESWASPPAKVTSLTPQMVVHSEGGLGTNNGFKARAMPAKLNTYKAAIVQKAEERRRNSIEAFPNCTLPSPSKPVPVPPPPSDKPDLRPALKSYTVELLPKNFPPHRIPVDYALFRRVKRLRKTDLQNGYI